MASPFSFFGGFKLTLAHIGRPRVTTSYPSTSAPSNHANTGVTSLTATRTGWRSALVVSCARGVSRELHLRARSGQSARPPREPGERYGYVYEINYLRCIHCDLCVEACPTQAITESKMFEFSFTNRADAIYTKAELLVDDQGFPSACLGGLARGRSRDDWRLDARDLASGDAAFEGVVQWTGDLGAGVRAAEGGQSGNRDDEATGSKQIREVFYRHLQPEDVPADRRGSRA